MVHAHLTEKQEAFAQAMAVHRNPARAYFEAFDIHPEHRYQAWVSGEGQKLRNSPKVAQRIRELTDAATAASPVIVTLVDLINYHASVLRFDPNEFIEVHQGACRYCHGWDHQYQFYDDEYAEAVVLAERMKLPMPEIKGGLGYKHFIEPHPTCTRCGGGGIPWETVKATAHLSDDARAGFGGVKMTRQGREVIMASKTESAKELARLLGLGGDTVTVKGQIGIAAALASVEAGTDVHAAAEAYAAFVKAGTVG